MNTSLEVVIQLVSIYSNIYSNIYTNTNIIIIRYFYKVLDILLILYSLFITPLTINTPLSSRIIDNLKYTPYFDNCLRALDRIYIAVYISTNCNSLATISYIREAVASKGTVLIKTIKLRRKGLSTVYIAI